LLWRPRISNWDDVILCRHQR